MIIFLDIDGVLKPHSKRYDLDLDPQNSLDSDCIKYLNEITDFDFCEIVVSSTWRRMEYCRQILKKAGMNANFHKIWKTPSDISIPINNPIRTSEISAWLQINNKNNTPYIILDDDIISDPLAKRHVPVNPHTGLTSISVNSAINLFE